MAILAIKGHATRGKEVIEILKMLGGINTYKINYTEKNLLYCLREGDNVIIATYPNTSITKVFTIERFLEKYPYKVGDKVLYKTYGIYSTIKTMKWNAEKEQVFYRLYSKNLFVATVGELNPCKEETMEEKTDTALAPDLKGEDYSDRRFGYKIPNGYEFECVRKNEIILKPIKPKYPKTYEECCKILQTTHTEWNGYLGEVLVPFQKLLICRNAYWKIAGEQMGLGKPWKQDYDDRCFIIANNEGNIHTYEYHGSNNVILALPTEEIRDVFYGNFKELIEECKEFL